MFGNQKLCALMPLLPANPELCSLLTGLCLAPRRAVPLGNGSACWKSTWSPVATSRCCVLHPPFLAFESKGQVHLQSCTAWTQVTGQPKGTNARKTLPPVKTRMRTDTACCQETKLLYFYCLIKNPSQLQASRLHLSH